MKYYLILISILIFSLIACKQENSSSSQRPAVLTASDAHSFARPEEVVTTHLTLDLNMNFDSKTITGTAVHTIQNHGADTFIVDTKGLMIEEVRLDDSDKSVTPLFGEEDAILGRALKIPVSRKTKTVAIKYSVPRDAAALGWLEPVQTAGKTSPFLYTQGQAILTRTWIPVQDSPGIRFTYEATIHVPPGLMAAMSATNPQQRSSDGVYRFKMDRPVPAYLIALAVGDFDFSPIGKRTGVYAEPPVVEKATYEFADMEKMVEIAEGLYGPYLWDRYDVIILPPSFPFGGMENPKLTFATPTVIAGDRSLVSLIAHELAHSWSGNLVTNATWNDFWLNEGFTTYFENRIMEALYGKEYADMLALLGYQDLQKTVEDLGKGSDDTHLLLDLGGRDPDDGMNSIAYEKGAFFLKRLEQAAGREKFDAFLREYFESHKFQSMSTAGFVSYLKENLLEPNKLDINVDAWVSGSGIPADCPVIESDRFVKVEAVVKTFIKGTPAADLPVREWTTHEWLHFIRHLPKDLNQRKMENLDATFSFSRSGNSEIAVAWYELAIRNTTPDNNYAVAIMPQIEGFLTQVGRRKYLLPLYRAMKESGRLEEAQRIFLASRQNYHSVSNNTLSELLGV
ncbi:MAG TPA: M1 family metallopeptidase [Saprospiraceae bacterium]|nr:M1 family metallopeptidase [Saprospiraceae bacterium]